MNLYHFCHESFKDHVKTNREDIERFFGACIKTGKYKTKKQGKISQTTNKENKQKQ